MSFKLTDEQTKHGSVLLTHFYFPSSQKNLFSELIAISLEQQLLPQSFGISINQPQTAQLQTVLGSSRDCFPMPMCCNCQPLQRM